MGLEKNVSVVIINYNNARFAERCLKPLLDEAVILEIMVVDDASTDDSIVEFGRFPVKIIKNEKNIGPVASRNKGAARAKGTYLLFLDSDTELQKGYISKLVAFLRERPRAAVATGKIIGQTGERIWFNFGYDPYYLGDKMQKIFDDLFLHYYERPLVRNILKTLARPFTLNFVADKIRKVDWVIEMAFMTRRDIFEKLHGLDEHFFMFFEGPDYCRRVRVAGYDVYYFPDAVCKDLGGHSHSEKRDTIFKESRDYYLRKFS